MRIVVAFCAVLVCLDCAPALSAPLRPTGANLFDEIAPRPPGLIPHARPSQAAAAPLPRPKPANAARSTPAAAVRSGPIVFPPVAPLE